MKRRILSGILAVCMLLIVCQAVAFAAVPDYEYSKIAYFVGGTPTNSITGGTTVTAKIKVKSATTTNTLLFTSFLYKGNSLVQIAMDETPTALSTSEAVYEATLSVPSDITSAKIITLLWEDAKDMVPVCSSSILPSSAVKLTSLSVDGVPVTNFSPNTYEYTMPVAANQVYAPYVRYTAVDNGANVVIIDATDFPGKSVVTVTSSDGQSTATYTINYTCDNLVKVISVANSSGRDGTVDHIIARPNLQLTETLFPDRIIKMAWLSPEIAGSYYITCPVLGGGNAGAFSYTFALRRGGNLSVYSMGGYETAHDALHPSSDGWVKDSTSWDTSALNNWPNDTNCGCTTHAAEHASTGGCYCVINAAGACTGVSRIGTGLDKFPGDPTAQAGSKYDNRNQGFFYYDYRTVSAHVNPAQLSRDHDFGAHSVRYTKYFDAAVFGLGDTVTSGSITIQKKQDAGRLVTIDFDDYLPNTYMGF